METPNVPTPAPVPNAAKPDANAGNPGNKSETPVKPAANAEPNKPPVPKLKIRDQEYAEEELASLIEKARRADEIERGANKKFQESAAARKEVENVLRQLKSNPGKVLLNKSLGHNPAAVIREIVSEAAEAGMDVSELKKALSEIMYQWIEEENLDPKERENRQLRKELDRKNAAEKAAKEEQDRQQLEDLTKKAYASIDKDITDALKDSGLPKSTFTVKRMAYYLDQAFKLKQQYEAQGKTVRDPKASELVQFVKRDYENMFRDLYQSADVETLIKLVGEENVNRIRQYGVTRFKQGQTRPEPTKTPSTPRKEEKSVERPKSSKDFLKQREAEIRAKEREERGY